MRFLIIFILLPTIVCADQGVNIFCVNMKKKLKIKLKKGKKRGPGRPTKNSEKDNPFVEDDLDDLDFDENYDLKSWKGPKLQKWVK